MHTTRGGGGGGTPQKESGRLGPAGGGVYRRSVTKSRFAGDGRVRGACLTRPTRAPPSVTRGGAMGVANERLVGLAVRRVNLVAEMKYPYLRTAGGGGPGL